MHRLNLRTVTMILAASGCLAAASEVDATIQKLKTEMDPQARLAAVKKLQELKDPKAIPALVEALTPKAANPEEDWFVGGAASLALSSFGKVAYDPLMAVLKDQKNAGVVRRRALEGISRMRQPGLVDLLKDYLKNDPDPKVRTAAAFQLRDLKDMSAIPALEAAAASDPDADVRKHATNAIAKMKGTK